MLHAGGEEQHRLGEPGKLAGPRSLSPLSPRGRGEKEAGEVKIAGKRGRALYRAGAAR